MTPRNVTENPARYYAWLQRVMSPGPHGENGNNAINTQTRKGPERSCPPRGDGCGSPPREAVEAQQGRASQ